MLKSMNVDHIFDTMNRHSVEYLLIGGFNFLLRHEPVLTFDVDFWIHDTPENRARCEQALAALEASWGADESSWGPVAALPKGWLERQTVFCLVTPHGAVDIFRTVRGLADWTASRARAVSGSTAAGTAYVGLSDEDMLETQEALDKQDRNLGRIGTLRRKLRKP